MNYFQLVENQLVVQEYIHIEQFLVRKTAKKGQISSYFLKISKNQQKITDVPHFDVLPAVYKNFWGMKTICDRKNAIRGNEYEKMRKIVGGDQKSHKSAQIYPMNGKIPLVHDFSFS